MAKESRLWNCILSIPEEGTDAHSTMRQRFFRSRLIEMHETTWQAHGVDEDGAHYNLSVAEYEPESLLATWIFKLSSSIVAGVTTYAPGSNGTASTEATFGVRLVNGEAVEAKGVEYVAEGADDPKRYDEELWGFPTDLDFVVSLHGLRTAVQEARFY